MNFVDSDDLFRRVATKKKGKVTRKLRANCCSSGQGSFKLAPALSERDAGIYRFLPSMSFLRIYGLPVYFDWSRRPDG